MGVHTVEHSARFEHFQRLESPFREQGYEGPWVYFVQQENGGPVKIGFAARRVASRCDVLQAGNPERLLCHLLIPGGQRIEAHFHRVFASLRYRNEWFAADDPEAVLAPARDFHAELVRRVNEGKPIRLAIGETLLSQNASRRAQIAEWRAHGLTIEQIAALLGCGYESARQEVGQLSYIAA